MTESNRHTPAPRPTRRTKPVQLLSVLNAGLGSAGFIHEVFYQHGERPWIILACLVLLGVVPATLIAEKWRQ